MLEHVAFLADPGQLVVEVDRLHRQLPPRLDAEGPVPGIARRNDNRRRQRGTITSSTMGGADIGLTTLAVDAERAAPRCGPDRARSFDRVRRPVLHQGVG